MTSPSFLHRIRRTLRKPGSAYHPSHESYKWWVLANVMIGTFMAVLDSTIVNVGLPKIMASFGVGLDKIEWVLTAYMLSLAVMLPTSAWLSDKFGYKKIYFYGLLLFTLGSFLCGLSNEENMLIISRVIQGLGAGIIMPIGMAIVTKEFPPNQRGVAIGFWAIAAAASVSFGPLIGGYLIDQFNWQLMFDVNIPVGIVGMFVTVIVQQEYKNPRIGKFDIVGFISASIFLPVLLYALSEGSASTNAEGWGAPYILICFAISIIAVSVFITTELIVKHPLMDLRLLANRNFGISNIIMFIFGMGMFGSTFLLPLYLQNSLGYTAVQAGAVFLPVGILQGIVSPFSGKLSGKINPKILIIAGIVLLTASFYMNYFLSLYTEHAYIMLSLYLRGLGLGILFTPLSTIAFLEIRPDKMAQASGLFNIIRQIGGSFGVALLATVLISRVSFHNEIYSESINSHSPSYHIVSDKISERLVYNSGSTKSIASRQASALIAGNIRNQSYIQGVDDDFLAAAFITVIGGIPVLLLHAGKKRLSSITKKVETYD